MAETLINTIKNADENLETYCLIWLDASINSSPENVKVQQQLRSSINHLLLFEDDQQCLEYIHSIPKDDRIVLVVSGKFGQIIVPQIVQLRQIISVYIYCTDKKANEEWSRQFTKVKAVMIRLDQLIHKIKSDQTQRQHQKIDETLPMSVLNSKINSEGSSSIGLTGEFIHSQLLIDCLIRMKSSLQEKKEFIDFCKQQYKNNPVELQMVKEFERDYSSDRSLWWYTRQSFLYRLLNKALRVQNTDLLYLFHFIIHDIGIELGKNRCLSHVHVYRAQQMSKDEVEILRQSIGKYISINSFLSTTINRDEARSCLLSTDPSENTEQVFFKISADPRLENIKPFANISSLSYFSKKVEVLFMVGSIFRIVEMKRDNQKIWNIQLVLCSENSTQLQLALQNIKKETGPEETNFLRFGNVLFNMGKLDDAEKYYYRCLEQLSEDHPSRSACYHALGMVSNAKNDYDSSLIWYNKSLEIDIQILKLDHPDIATSHNNMAIVYYNKGDSTRALEFYEKALMIWEKVYGGDHLDVAMCLSNMGVVYQEEKNYSKALQYHQKALLIRQKHLPSNHSDLGDSYGNLGVLYGCLGHYDQALRNFNTLLEIKSKSRPHQHPDIAMTLENIGLIHEKKSDYEQAILYFNQAATIYHHALPPTHPDVIQIEQSIQRVSSKLK